MLQLSKKSWKLARYLLSIDSSRDFVKVPANLRGKKGGDMIVVFRSEVKAHFAGLKIIGQKSRKEIKAYKTVKWAERKLIFLEKQLEKAAAVTKLRHMKGEVHVYGRGYYSVIREIKKIMAILNRALKKLGADIYRHELVGRIEATISTNRFEKDLFAAETVSFKSEAYQVAKMWDLASFLNMLKDKAYEKAMLVLDYARRIGIDRYYDFYAVVSTGRVPKRRGGLKIVLR